MAAISIEGVQKVYPDGTVAVAGVDLQIPDGSFAVLVGPSGCGKTTLLRMLAGLEPITEGTVRIGDRVVNAVAPQDRDIAMVFQSYALYPHLTVRDNLGFGLRRRRVRKSQIELRVREVAELLELTPLLDKRPPALSGGQRQRVAMGRAIARHPQAFLMDEPLSNLDAKLRAQMRAEIARLQQELRVTTVYVTHDQTEAMTLGDVVAVMRSGRLQQVADPQTVFDHPANLFVAGFIGAPAMNLVRALIASGEGGLGAEFGGHRILIPAPLVDACPALERRVGEHVALGLRPEDLSLAASHDASSRMRAELDVVETLGRAMDLHFTVDAPAVFSEDPELEPPVSSTTRFVARVNRPEQLVRPGDRVELAVEAAGLHFFDLRTGASLRQAPPASDERLPVEAVSGSSSRRNPIRRDSDA